MLGVGRTVRTRRAVWLPCPLQEAWEVLVDWERQADWLPDADRVRVVSVAREGVGVRLAVKTRLFGVPLFTEPIEVIGWDPPRVLRIRHGGPIGGSGTWALVAEGVGTRFTWTEDLRLAVPLVGAMAAWCYRPFLRWLMGRSTEGLRRRIVAAGPRRDPGRRP
jgi:hypothetical protein